jgi:hypothetical protein
MKVKGGDKFEAALKQIAADLSQPGKVRVGFLEGATYPDGQTVAEVAAYNEYGRMVRGNVEESATGKGDLYYQLPRPFFRNMIDAKSGEWPEAVRLNLKATKYNVPLTLGRVGEGIKGQLQQSIRDLVSPPLAESTIQKKGFDKPLIDTGHMINSAAWQVVGEKIK